MLSKWPRVWFKVGFPKKNAFCPGYTENHGFSAVFLGIFFRESFEPTLELLLYGQPAAPTGPGIIPPEGRWEELLGQDGSRRKGPFMGAGQGKHQEQAHKRPL